MLYLTLEFYVAKGKCEDKVVPLLN